MKIKNLKVDTENLKESTKRGNLVLNKIESAIINIVNFVKKQKRKIALALAIIMCGTFSLGLVGCSKNDDKNAITFNTYIEPKADEKSNETLCNKIINLEDEHNTIEIEYNDIVTDEKEKDEIDLGTSLEKLENMIQCYRELSEVKGIKRFDKQNESYEEEFNTIIANGHNVEDIKNLIKDYEEADNVEKVRLSQQIKGLHDYYETWINNNAQEICKKALLQSIKVATLEAMGEDVNNYKKCTVDPLIFDKAKIVNYRDIETNKVYKINFDKSESLSDALGTYTEIAANENGDVDDKIEEYNETVEQLVNVLETKHTCEDFKIKDEKEKEEVKIKSL